MASDFRVALRLLWKDPAFTVTAALTLAVCIGANTALFSVVHNVLLRPLPVPESDRIVLMANAYPGAGAEVGTNSGVPDYYDRLRETTVFEEQALFNIRIRSTEQNGTPVRIRTMPATPSLFRLLRVAPLAGRTFTEQEGEIGNEKKAVLSYALWQSQFGGDRSAIGRDIRVDGQPYAIVGVMPQGFSFIDPDVMLWIPLAFTPQQKSDEQRHSNNYQNVARLKPGATIEEARRQIDALNTANLDRFPQYKELLINTGFHTSVDRLQDTLVRDVKATLYLMWGGALFVLLIGCVNVANLVLVRSRARLKELATRLALGAGRLRVGRQLVTESVLLTLAASSRRWRSRSSFSSAPACCWRASARFLRSIPGSHPRVSSPRRCPCRRCATTTIRSARRSPTRPCAGSGRFRAPRTRAQPIRFPSAATTATA
jgi:putative ABC transport system permease protein